MKRSILVALGLCFFSCAANAALVELEFTGRGGMSPSCNRTYLYDCSSVIQLNVVFDTSAYTAASMGFQEIEDGRLDLGRLYHWRFSGMPVQSMLLRADERILLDDPTGLSLSSIGANISGSNTSGCLCDFGIAGGGIAIRINVDTVNPDRLLWWPMAADLVDDPLAVLLAGPGRRGSSSFNNFSGSWGSFETGADVTVSAVPVPAAVWLFGSALGVMGWVRRKHETK
jgi:hypothetical protein